MTDAWETEGGAIPQTPEKTVENRATSVIPIQYSGRTYDLRVHHGDRGNYRGVDGDLDPTYVTLGMYVDDGDLGGCDVCGAGNDHDNNIAFHTRDSFVRAVEAIITHGVKAFGSEVLDDLGIY